MFGSRQRSGAKHWTAWTGQCGHTAVKSSSLATMCVFLQLLRKWISHTRVYFEGHTYAWPFGWFGKIWIISQDSVCAFIFILKPNIPLCSSPNLWSILEKKKGGCSLTTSSASLTPSCSRSVKLGRTWKTCSGARKRKSGGHGWRPWWENSWEATSD